MDTHTTRTSPLERGWVLAGGDPIYHRHHEVAGTVPLVHCHGFAISGEYMMPTAERLAGTYTQAVPDLPGFGRSPRGPVLSISALAAGLHAYIDALGMDQIVLVGNSLGCPITLAFALAHPERVRGLVLCSPAGGRHNQPLLRAAAQLAADGPREPLSMARVAVPDYLHFGVVSTLRLFQAMCRYDAFHALTRIQAPTLVVMGSRDPLLPPSRRVRQVARQLEGTATAVVIKDAAHAINYSHPDEVSAVVDQWLQGTPVVGTADGAPVALLKPS